MASPIDSLIETLTETRVKLEEQLGRNEAYRALRQLEQREASGERLDIVSSDRLRQAIEVELGTDSYFKALRQIDEALGMLETWSAGASVPTTPIAGVVAVTAEPGQPPAASSAPLPIDIAGAPADDLSLIRDLPVACVSVVAAAGFGRYQALASIDSAGVALLERLLGQRGIVARGNWIEQAAILAQGRETRYAARLIALRSGADWPPQPLEPEIVEAIAAPKPEASVVETASEVPVAAAPVAIEPTGLDARLAEPHDLTHIAGIDRALAARLTEDGITFSRLAAWTAVDAQAQTQALGISLSRISAEGWIEQAAMLASGRVSRFLVSKTLRVPLAPLPPKLDIPLDAEPAATGEVAVEPAAATADSSEPQVLEPIVVPPAANDDRPPRTEDADDVGAGISPAIWPAAAAKAAILRPLRKPADRGDKAFDDVAALVAQTVATARNVGGMAERPAPAAPPVASGSVPAPAEPPRPSMPVKPAPAPIAKTPPATTKIATRGGAAVAPTATVFPSPPRPEQVQTGMRIRSTDPEASIEIRVRPAAADGEPAALRRSPGEASPSKLASPATASPSRPASGRPIPLAAPHRQPSSPALPARRMVLIDEFTGTAAPPIVIEEPKPAGPLLAARASDLFSRLVKALKGNASD